MSFNLFFSGHILLFGFFPSLYCVMKHLCKVKKTKVDTKSSYSLPQKTLRFGVEPLLL